ncbi:MAG: inositol monophosphatase family protein [Actinomycetes bacterium]
MSAPTRSLAEVLDLHPLLPMAWHAAGAAGRFLRDERPKILAVDTKSSPTDAVTVMDRTAEAMISAALLGPRPDDGLLGEEGGERLGASGVRWIVDPLDGTVNYLSELPMWGVSIAAEEHGLVTVGVVVTPEFDEGYIAVRGQGSWHIDGADAHPLQASGCTDLAAALVTTGFGYDAQLRKAQAEVVTGLITQIRDVRRMGAAVVDFCWLARGRVDGYYERGLNAWDYAAGALIAQEAGAFVSGLRDDDLSTFIFAAAPGIAAELRSALVTLNADLV